LGDYTLFVYRPQSALFTYFADRIYTSGPEAMTEAGITVGSTYAQVTNAYGKPPENGYLERFPFPIGARGDTPDRYAIDYESLGLSFIFASTTNRVTHIGIYKLGS